MGNMANPVGFTIDGQSTIIVNNGVLIGNPAYPNTQYASVVINASDIYSMNTSPIQLTFEGFGAGNALFINMINIQNAGSTTPFLPSGSGTVYATYGTSTPAHAFTTTITAANFAATTSNQWFNLYGQGNTYVQDVYTNTDVENQNVYLTSNVSFTGGDGIFVAQVFYFVMSLL